MYFLKMSCLVYVYNCNTNHFYFLKIRATDVTCHIDFRCKFWNKNVTLNTMSGLNRFSETVFFMQSISVAWLRVLNSWFVKRVLKTIKAYLDIYCIPVSVMSIAPSQTHDFFIRRSKRSLFALIWLLLQHLLLRPNLL